MKKVFLLLFMASTLVIYSQQPNLNVLSTVNTVKPKPGQKMAFEAAYKVHIAKFHTAAEKLAVYEILSGENAGCYHLVNGGRSYADFDKVRADAAAHSLDLDKTFFPMLDKTTNGTYRWVDSCSMRSDVVAESFIVTVRHLKQGLNQTDYRRELARGVKINLMLKDPFFENLSFSFFDQIWDGSDQVTVTLRNLKDGFKSLEANYYGPINFANTAFRAEYEKAYGGAAYDERVKLLDTAVEKTEQYIMRLRKDLSSQ